ncbi:hypothetical protein NKH18_09510 [Streptomyces sp. M10(2022)]
MDPDVLRRRVLGHSGSGFGYVVSPAVTAAGQPSAAVTVTAHSRPGDPDTAGRQLQGVTDLIDHALCAEPSR